MTRLATALVLGALLATAGLDSGCRQKVAAAHDRQPAADLAELVAEADAIDGLLALVVQRDGHVLLDESFDRTKSGELLHLRSATKSVLSLLVGIAIDRGRLASVDVTLGEILGAAVEPFGARKAAITVEHLLTMTAGLEWDESTVEEYNRWRVSRDPVAHYLRRPLVAEPGTIWSYSSGASHLLSVVLSEATGRPTRVWAEEVLFEPLGIRHARWETVAGGRTNGAAGLQLRPRDTLKIGELVLARGVWGERRIVSESWIEAATRGHRELGEGNYYGYQWWIHDQESLLVWGAQGYAGQVLAILPRDELIVVANCRWRGLSRPSAEQSRELRDFLVERLIPTLATDREKQAL